MVMDIYMPESGVETDRCAELLLCVHVCVSAYFLLCVLLCMHVRVHACVRAPVHRVCMTCSGHGLSCVPVCAYVCVCMRTCGLCTHACVSVHTYTLKCGTELIELCSEACISVIRVLLIMAYHLLVSTAPLVAEAYQLS